jgi:hypothetical protein
MKRPTERSEAREQQDAGRDVDGAADATPQMRRLGVREPTEGAQRPGRGREREEQTRADGQLEGRRADRAADRAGELHVRARLERQQAADEEEEWDCEDFHRNHPVRELT